MRIECPSCEIAYDVPEERLRGRKLRCAGCGNSWVPLPAAQSTPVPEPVPPPAPPAPVSTPAALVPPTTFPRMLPSPLPSPRRRPKRVLLGWVVTILLCAGGGFAAFHFRPAVMHAWPPSIRIYRALGLGVNPIGR